MRKSVYGVGEIDSSTISAIAWIGTEDLDRLDGIICEGGSERRRRVPLRLYGHQIRADLGSELRCGGVEEPGVLGYQNKGIESFLVLVLLLAICEACKPSEVSPICGTTIAAELLGQLPGCRSTYFFAERLSMSKPSLEVPG